jgi:hypothetical protein
VPASTFAGPAAKYYEGPEHKKCNKEWKGEVL